MFPRIPLLVLLCCWWQFGPLLMLVPQVCLAEENYHQENHQAEEQHYDENVNDYQQDNNQEYHDNNQEESYQEDQRDDHHEEQHHNQEDHNDNQQWEQEHQQEDHDTPPENNHDNDHYEQHDDNHHEHSTEDLNEYHHEEQQHYDNNHQEEPYDSNPEPTDNTPEEYHNNDQQQEEYHQDNQNEDHNNNDHQQEEYYDGNRNDEHQEEYQHNDQHQDEQNGDNYNEDHQDNNHDSHQQQDEYHDENQYHDEHQEEHHDSDQNQEQSYDDNQNEDHQGEYHNENEREHPAGDISLDEPTYDEPNYPEPQPHENDEPAEENADYDESTEQPDVQEDDDSNSDYQPTDDKPVEDFFDYEETEWDPSHVDDEPGVDFSWPIHYFRNRHPTAEESGRRSRRHWQFLKGCSLHYSIEECKTSDAERMMMNLRQPRILMNYTSAGYAKMQAPKGVYSMLQNFYRKHGNRQVRENWPPGNIYTNHWSSPVKLLPVSGLPHTQGQVDPHPSLSQQQRKDIISQIQPVLETWCKMPLIPTSMYGIRTYKRGSILAPHVDRLPLVISVIINVDQEVVEDWPLEIIDHSGRATNVTMKPGDMVLYESASVVHGRPYPLNGQTYSNLFLHFEPVGYSERHHNSADQKKRRKDPKALFEEALAKQQNADTRQLNSWEQKQHDRPYYVTPKHDEQWEQKYVYVKRKSNKKPKKNSKTVKINDTDKDDERLFHNLAAKGLLLKMKELVMEDPAIITRKDNNGWLALHEAARAGQTHVVEYLCNLMETSEINARTNGGRGATPTWWAMHMFAKDHPTVRTLLKHGGKSIAPNSSNNKKT